MFAIAGHSAAHETAKIDARAFGAIRPRISPDGETIAFSYQGAIWKMPRAGGPATRLTSGDGFDIEPAWSPDGNQIAYINSRNFSSGALAVVEVETGRRLPLALDAIIMDKLHFDRAGRRVLGVFQPTSERPRLAWCEIATGALVSAVDEKLWPGLPLGTPGVARQRVALSNDGRYLAVNTTADLPGEQTGNNGPQNEIWRVPLEEGRPELISRWPARIHDMCWRADDRGLLVVTERGGVHNDLWEVPLENAEAGAKKLTFAQADEDSPSTAADGKWLVYTDNRHGPTMLMLRDLSSESGVEQAVAPTRLDFGAPTGKLHLHVVEADRDTATTARIVVRHAEGKFHAPPGALYRLLGADLHFYAQGGAAFELPVGEYSLKAGRGPEHRLAKAAFQVRPGEETILHVRLERWTNQRAAGWISGENHIHANYGYGQWYNSPATMRLQCTGEDLIVANFMVANSDGDGVFDREFFLGRPDPLSTADHVLYWNEEFRSTIWGHMTLLNLKRLVTPIFTGFNHTTHSHDAPTNAEIADHTHEQDGLVNYTHPAHSLQDPYATAYSAKELPVDVALGKVDSLDVMGSNHQATYPLWYRLLNCGLRVPASAGTDCFLNRINSRLPGSDRVYVKCGEKFTYQTWIENLRAGRTFVTNGPMLRFRVNGEEPGAVLRLSAPVKIRVEGEAVSQFPLETLEVVLNGRAVAVVKAEPEGPRQIRVEQEIAVEQSGWVALRVIGRRAPDHHAAELFAHTSPIYLEVADRPARSPEDARYFIGWIERLYKDVRARDRIPPRRQAQVEKTLADALDFYRKLAD